VLTLGISWEIDFGEEINTNVPYKQRDTASRDRGSDSIKYFSLKYTVDIFKTTTLFL
jgi:hypothetical protein